MKDCLNKFNLDSLHNISGDSRILKILEEYFFGLHLVENKISNHDNISKIYLNIYKNFLNSIYSSFKQYFFIIKKNFSVFIEHKSLYKYTKHVKKC